MNTFDEYLFKMFEFQFERFTEIPEYRNSRMAGRINLVDLQLVEEKVNDKRYKSTVEFLKDIQIIRHNVEIVLPGNQSIVR